jgi:tetratricopeptide (TPR) repeat protein
MVLQGCSISGVRDLTRTSSASEGPGSREIVAAQNDSGKPPPPAPEVQGRNAAVFTRATELLGQGRLVEAEALLLEVTSDQPELAGPWVNLAQVYLAQQRDDEALGALEQAVLANPANCAARTELGVLLRRRGEFSAAESHYLACLEYQPDYQAAYLNLGILYDLYLGRLTDALAAYRQFQSLAAEPDRRVNVWVVDLERRLDS